MSCIKNPKQWLFFKWNGEHDETITRVETFMRGDLKFIVHYECKKCGAKRKRHFVEWDEMLTLGFSNEQLEEIRWSYFGKDINEIAAMLNDINDDMRQMLNRITLSTRVRRNESQIVVIQIG